MSTNSQQIATIRPPQEEAVNSPTYDKDIAALLVKRSQKNRICVSS
jgi:hypothetical protein